MLNENLKYIRNEKGLSQEELANKLHVVRQTVSKWEQGLSVPDADMLVTISKALGTPVSVLLGDNIKETKDNDIDDIARKLEALNAHLAERNNQKRKRRQLSYIVLGTLTILAFVLIGVIGSPYIDWNFNDPETAVVGTNWHIAEWLFVRISPILMIVSIVGTVRNRKK